ncbi:MAG TPA: glycoside hydrolase family 2 TIM barrel-domain containing protein [Balneolales bacterium]|nr:glycoside hydrolase family 2 TIM barrel-domain containing protein [Balneolales bacterium]
MKKIFFYLLPALLTLTLLTGFSRKISPPHPVRQTINFDFNWRFHPGDVQGAANPAYDDARWRLLNVPHDWSIEGKFSAKNASGTGYLPAGIGWYRKTFTLPETDQTKRVGIQFDGVYDNSEVWINGHYLGKRPYGFISFYYNLTPYLQFGDQKNVIAVRVDHSHVADSRWYTGSGIDRHVRLYVTNKVRVVHWGTYVTTPHVDKNSATVRIITKIANTTTGEHEITLKSIVIDSSGNVVGQTSSRMAFRPDSKYKFDQTISVDHPELWSIEHPAMYSVVSEIYAGRQLEDRDTTLFGIRTIRFDADKGFFLNGKPVTIKGVCLHNDAGAVGSAVPEREWYRRLKLMKDMGANAIRTSHNPPAPEFLRLCDRMGFLVMDEAFDEWAIGKKKWIKGRNVGSDKGAAGLGSYYSQNGYSDFFQKWHKKDIQDMVRRDRNHPSIILWSIGNEIDYPNDPYTDPNRSDYKPWRPAAYQIPKIARHLYDDVKEIDTTRPVTAALANIPLSNQTGYAGLLDVVGYNYQEQYYKKDHENFPKRKIMGSENGGSYQAWLAVKDNAFVAGQFLWTGVDYLGEAGRFPNRSSLSGRVGLSDFRKPRFYYRQSLWSHKPMVYIACVAPETGNRNRYPHVTERWNWDEFRGKDVTVVAYTNCTSVRLYLNGKSLGSKGLSESKDAILKWTVPYRPGELKAVAYRDGKVVAQHILQTAGKPYKIILKSDRTDVHADGEDIASVKILVTDKNGIVVPYASNEIRISVSGAGVNDGIGNDDSNDIEPYKSDHHKVFEGKARIYILSNDKKGAIHLDAVAKGLKTGRLTIEAK